MKILHFTDPIEFQNRTRELLLENETENNLPLGILASLVAGEFLEKPPYLSLVEEGELRLAMICTPPYPVLFTYHVSPISTKLLEAVLADLAEKLGENFTGITGNKTLTAELARIWQDISPGEAELKMAMRIYRLDHVDPVSGVPGRLRSAEYRDKALLLEWFTNFHRDSLGGEPDPGRVEKQVDRYLNASPGQRGLMLWEVQGQLVSMAGYSGPTPNGIRIGAVFTPRELRKKGFASACTAGLSQALLNRGFKHCFLFTDLLNPISNHIYQQIGYKPVCDVDQYQFIRKGLKGS